MRDFSMPSPVIDVTDTALSSELPTDVSPAERAESVLPEGYTPPVVPAGSPSPADVAAAAEVPDARVVPTEVLRDAVERLREIRIAARVLRADDELSKGIEFEAGRLVGIFRGLVGGALVLALAVAVLVAAPSPRAQAAEIPQPDPAPAARAAQQVIPVVLDRAFVAVPVRATAINLTPRGLHCASVWSTATVPAFLGRACSPAASFTVRAIVDARQLPLGRSLVQVTDDVAPLMAAPVPVVLDARRPSRFGRGVWMDRGRGDVLVSAPLVMYSPAAGRWLPQQYSPVQVQELVAGRWLVRATLTTTAAGTASGVVHLGGGAHIVRVARPAGASVWSTVGTTRTLNLLSEPIDVI